MMEALNEEIEGFKCDWLREIYLKRKEIHDGNCYNDTNRFDLAMRIYKCGLKAEGYGELQVAVEQYRRATLLIPDIERQIRPYLQVIELDQNRKEMVPIHDVIDPVNDASEVYMEDHQSLILTLPDELLLYIMRWIVGSDVDLFSLLLLNKVCSKFRSLSLDEQLWRLVCQRLWPRCGSSDTHHYGGTWRFMAISRPHLLYHGCYIGTVTYFRRGEPTANVYNAPFLVVRYYRVVRFKSDGTVTMVTSALDPQDIMRQMSLVDTHDISTLGGQLSQSSIATGTYTIDGSTIWMQVTRRIDLARATQGLKYQRKYLTDDHSQQHLMDICLTLKSSLTRPNHVLLWTSFSLTVVRKTEALLSEFDVSSSQYPRMVFSPVRSFSSRLSQAPI